MISQVLKKLMALLLIVICPSAILMAERPGAMLRASGIVSVNGSATPQSMSVFTGDRINTAEGAAVSITRSGLSLVVDPNSSVQYQDDGFAILKGTVRVRTSKGVTAHAGPVSVGPKGDSALFDVSSDGKTALVTSREGTLILTDGVEMASLDSGYTAKISLDLSESQDQSPKPAAKSKGDKNNKKGFIIWILVAAAAGAGITCAVTCGGGGGPTPVSPVLP
jgi:ethanolamine utilization protein EutQ (cupin superfamily)